MRSPLFTGATSYLNPSKCQTLIKRVLSLLSAPQEGYGWFPQDSGVFRRNVAEVDGGVNTLLPVVFLVEPLVLNPVGKVELNA